jgi:hypothetical protein
LRHRSCDRRHRSSPLPRENLDCHLQLEWRGGVARRQGTQPRNGHSKVNAVNAGSGGKADVGASHSILEPAAKERTVYVTETHTQDAP